MLIKVGKCKGLRYMVFELFNVWSVTVQLNKVEVHELKPKVLTKDKGGLVWRQTSNWVTRVSSTT